MEIRAEGISFSDEVLTWVRQALHESYAGEKKFHDAATPKLRREHKRIQDRIDAMYMDKLDGRIDNEFFDRKAAEFRSEQCRLMRDIDAHQTASSCSNSRSGRTSYSKVSLLRRNGNCSILYFGTARGRAGS